MVTPRLEVLQPGLQSTVQDWPGRIGFWRVGIPPSGPMDDLAFRLANHLVGNDPGAAGVEFQLVGPKLRADCNVDLAVVSGSEPTIDGVRVETGQTLTLRRGQVLECGPVRVGMRGYLAVAGGFDKAPVLGSASTFPRGGIGGKALAAGDLLALAGPRAGQPRLQMAPGAIPSIEDTAIIEVTAGPHFDWLDAAGRAALVGGEWTVSSRSDRTGIRLSGPEVGFASRATDKAAENGPDPTNVINTGYAIGGVNLCGDTPIILPLDGPSQGGFITPIVVVSAALWRVGQLRPNKTLVFRRVSVDEAIEMRTALEARASAASLIPLSGEGDAS